MGALIQLERKMIRAIILLLLSSAVWANPTTLEAVDINPTGATLVWDVDPYATEYHVWKQTTGPYGTIWSPLVTVVGTSFVVDTLQLGWTRAYRVTSNYDSFPTVEVEFTTAEGAAPELLFDSRDFPQAESVIPAGRYKIKVVVIDPSLPKGSRVLSKETVKFNYE